MKKLLLMATAIATIGGITVDRASACNLRLPIFELMGFPISSHQVALLGGANVVERSATPTLTLAGMPASPHQIAVLTPRSKTAKIPQAPASKSTVTVGLASSLLRSANAAEQAACIPE